MEVQEEYSKKEIKRCELCCGWIERNIHRLYKYNMIFYYHPFCYTRVTTSYPVISSRNISK